MDDNSIECQALHVKLFLVGTLGIAEVIANIEFIFQSSWYNASLTIITVKVFEISA